MIKFTDEKFFDLAGKLSVEVQMRIKIVSYVLAACIACMPISMFMTGSFAAAAESGAQASSENENVKTDDGIPWINSELKENITDETPVDPKEDFHLYANKEWLMSNEIPDGYNVWSHYSEREVDVENQCLEILNEESVEGHDAELLYTYYRLLLDWDARNNKGVSELKGTYDRILSAENLDDITNLMMDTESSPIINSFLINFAAEVGFNDPDKYLVKISLPGLLLEDSAEYSERTGLGDMYYGLRKEMFAFIVGKLGMSEENAYRIFDAAIELETKLSSKIYTTKETNQDDYIDRINNEMTYSELTALSKVFPLDQILSTFGYQYEGSYLVVAPDYIKLLDEIYTEENLEGIKALMLVRYIYEFRLILDKEIYDKYNELQSKYLGISGTVPDEEMAYLFVMNVLPTSMQKVYISKYSSAEDKKKMEELCQTVIDTYREMLSDNAWASDEVKKYAIEKLDNITIHAAYPDKFRDTSGLDLSGCSLVGAYNRLGGSELVYNRSLIGKEVDKEMWAEGFDILSCNAFYSWNQNTINMIIGMMGEPFYSSDMSIEELYASIGAFWVGHEISHAFDSRGAIFDANGVYRDWWTDEDKEEFKKRVKKIDDYLDTIVAFGGLHFIGTNIDTEMIADMTGLQCALRMASKVPDFDYQKFFTKYARMNGSLGLYSAELTQLLQDEHPLNYSRTNVPVQQFDEFYETFDVREGNSMYLAPEDRLLIW